MRCVACLFLRLFKEINVLTTQASFDEKLHLAQQAISSGNYQRGFSLFAELRHSAPTRGDVCFHFGASLLLVEEFDGAIEQLSLACQMLPHEKEPLFKLLDAFEAVNSLSDVQTVIEFMLAQFPNQAEVLYRAANFYRESANLAKADDLALQTIALSNKPLLTSYAWLLRLNLGRMDTSQNIEMALLAILNNNANEQVRMVTHYALGRYYELAGNTALAFAHWKKANTLQFSLCDYSSADIATLFEAIKHSTVKNGRDQKRNEQNNATEQSTIRSSNNESINNRFTPIFIIGLPRTGSTLLEQALCKHTDVSSLGEEAIIGGQVAHYISHHTQQAYPFFMPTLNDEKGQALCQNAAHIYQVALSKRQLSTPFVIDKLPANFQSIGLIKALFPDARIIHITRHFEDTALSIYKNHFAVNEPYLCDLAELSTYNALYLNLMQHWHDIYPKQILEISYESLVEQHEVSMKKVLAYCGLSAQANCWQSNKGEIDSSMLPRSVPSRLVKTLSSAQVTKPVYKGAVGSHIPYATMLKDNGLAV